MTLFDRIQEGVSYLKQRGITSVDGAIVLGTGLGKLLDQVDIQLSIPYQDVPNFPDSTVEFHSGRLIYGRFEGKMLLIMQGRYHFYEGQQMADIGIPIWTFKMLGAQFLILSGAAGCLNLNWQKGDLMMISDHINLLPFNPLIGQNDERLGERFPDMSTAYDVIINQSFLESAHQLDITLRQGVYSAVQGPMLETAAEYRFLKTIGTDAVGMSTVPEVIVANHAKLRCSAVVVLTDECDPENLKPINITEVIAVAGEAEQKLIQLFRKTISSIPNG